MKESAVEWLVNELEKHYVKFDLKNTTVFLQAKEMEKQQQSYSEKQMDDSYDKGFNDAIEKMYSDEEVKYILYSLKNYLGFGEEINEKKWFEQFKKK